MIHSLSFCGSSRCHASVAISITSCAWWLGVSSFVVGADLVDVAGVSSWRSHVRPSVDACEVNSITSCIHLGFHAEADNQQDTARRCGFIVLQVQKPPCVLADGKRKACGEGKKAESTLANTTDNVAVVKMPLGSHDGEHCSSVKSVGSLTFEEGDQISLLDGSMPRSPDKKGLGDGETVHLRCETGIPGGLPASSTWPVSDNFVGYFR